MLKIHCWSAALQRKSVSGVVETTSSSIDGAPATVPTSLKLMTTPGVPTELPLASHTRNFAGTVLPCLKTLVPSPLIGWRIACPGEPRHRPLCAYMMLKSAPRLVMLVAQRTRRAQRRRDMVLADG